MLIGMMSRLMSFATLPIVQNTQGTCTRLDIAGAFELVSDLLRPAPASSGHGWDLASNFRNQSALSIFLPLHSATSNTTLDSLQARDAGIANTTSCGPTSAYSFRLTRIVARDKPLHPDARDTSG